MEIASYVTGFVDGEGCFSVSFSVRNKMRNGIEVRPSFSVSQHRRSKGIILWLQKYFGCGGVRYSKCDQNFKYEVRSIVDLMCKIIPHFEKYPLRTAKKEDFAVFKEICQLIYSNHHLSKEGLSRIIEIGQQLNITGNKRLQKNDLLKLIAR